MTTLATSETALTAPEQQRLISNETIIARGLQTFYEVGSALLDIRDNRLYRAQYRTFGAYCQERWGMSKPQATRLIQAADVMDRLVPMGTILPENERQARPLAQLPADQQPDAWRVAVETAPNGKPTAAHVASVVEMFRAPVTDDNLPFVPSVDDYADPYGDEELESADVDPGRPMKPKINRAGDPSTPQGFDACQTPPYAIDPLLHYLPMDWIIWEPAAGEGLLVEAFYDASRTVVASDILSGGNFFDPATEPAEWDCLITNPPYSIKYQWMERCYALGKPFALLLPVETLGAAKAQALFRQYGVQIILFDKRINFKMPNIGWEGSSAQFPVAWFTWGLQLADQLTFARLHDNQHTSMETRDGR